MLHIILFALYQTIRFCRFSMGSEVACEKMLQRIRALKSLIRFKHMFNNDFLFIFSHSTLYTVSYNSKTGICSLTLLRIFTPEERGIEQDKHQFVSSQ